MFLQLLRLLALAGVSMSLYLVNQHVDFVQSGEVSGLCTAAKTFDCSAIETSGYSSIGWLPTASFGSFFFLIYFLLLWFNPKTKGMSKDEVGDLEENYWSVVATFNAVGVIASLGFAGLSAFVIGGFCIGCTIIYAINAVMLLVLLTKLGYLAYFGYALRGIKVALKSVAAMFGQEVKPRVELLQRVFLFVVFFAIPINFGAPMLMMHRALSEPLIDRFITQELTQFETKPGTISKGNPDAPLDLVIFSDFKCPHCARFADELHDLLKDFSDDEVRVTFKHFPLDPRCNQMVAKLLDEGKTKLNHEHACEWAAMAQVLHETGNFWNYYRELYMVDDTMRSSVVEEIAQKIGVEPQAWLDRALSPPVVNRISADIDEGLALNIGGERGIPAIFINGRHVPSAKIKDVGRLMKTIPLLEK